MHTLISNDLLMNGRQIKLFTETDIALACKKGLTHISLTADVNTFNR